MGRNSPNHPPSALLKMMAQLSLLRSRHLLLDVHAVQWAEPAKQAIELILILRRGPRLGVMTFILRLDLEKACRQPRMGELVMDRRYCGVGGKTLNANH